MKKIVPLFLLAALVAVLEVFEVTDTTRDLVGLALVVASYFTMIIRRPSLNLGQTRKGDILLGLAISSLGLVVTTNYFHLTNINSLLVWVLFSGACVCIIGKYYEG
jgi:hypothetical protein